MPSTTACVNPSSRISFAKVSSSAVCSRSSSATLSHPSEFAMILTCSESLDQTLASSSQIRWTMRFARSSSSAACTSLSSTPETVPPCLDMCHLLAAALDCRDQVVVGVGEALHARIGQLARHGEEVDPQLLQFVEERLRALHVIQDRHPGSAVVAEGIDSGRRHRIH